MEMRMKQKRKILRHLAEELAVIGVVELKTPEAIRACDWLARLPDVTSSLGTLLTSYIA